jgi:hypothetical protein
MDFRVNRRIDAEIEKHAATLRQHFGVARGWANIIQCLKSKEIWTLWGKKRLILEICADHLLGSDDARTAYSDGVVRIAVKSSIFTLAEKGDGRARFTLAHEFGHAVMHPGAPKARRIGATRRREYVQIYPGESAERQADVFAAAFLIDQPQANDLHDPAAISTAFGVTRECATVFLDKRRKAWERAASVARVSKLVESFVAQEVCDPVLSIRYLEEHCPSCGRRTLRPDGTKYWCDSCKLFQDLFQDGDLVD